MNRKIFAVIIFLFVISAWSLRSLFGGIFYTNHDGYTHTVRIYQYVTALQDGQIPPRWAGTLNSGLGSPFFVFSYPLPYILGSILYWVGFSFVDAFKVIVGASFFLSGLFMFYFLQEIFDQKAAFIGSLFYILVPYRFLNIYVRGSLSESVAYVLVPVVFYGIMKVWKTKNNNWVVFSSFSFALLLLSQYLVAAIFLPVFLGMIAILLFNRAYRIFVYQMLMVLIFGFGISAFMYIPVFFERKFLRFSELISYYQNHFVNIFQLIRSPWGYGFSLPGTGDSMSFQIGLVHLLVVAVSIIFFALYIFNKKKKTKKEQLQFLFLSFSYLLFFVSIFLMIDTQLTKFVWKVVPFLTTVDIPWRFLGLTTFAASIVAAYFAQKFHINFFLIGLIILLIYANRNHIRVNQYSKYPDEEFIYYKGTATWLNEYTPVWRNSTSFSEFDNRYTVLDGEVEVIKEIESKSNVYAFRVDSKTNSLVRLNILYFPGWKISLDGKDVQEDQGFYVTTGDDRTIDDKDGSGLISVIVPEGIHTIRAQFDETPARQMGNGISMLSLVGLAIFSGVNTLHRKKKRNI